MSANQLPIIAAVVVTFRRESELARLLQSLQSSHLQPSLVVVVDNAALPSTEGLIAKFNLRTSYIASPENSGPGAGWKRGMESVLIKEPGTTHFLILDDDVVLPPQALGKLQDAAANAAVTCPMLLDNEGKIWGFPEPADRNLRRSIRQITLPDEAISVLGERPLPFLWCTGACLLIRRDAVDAVGFYRTDFWMLGEDLEYSMRLAAFGGGLFLPDLFVSHLPPQSQNSAEANGAHRRKFTSLLQNLAYLSFHHPASGPMKHYLAGNARRYLRTFGWNLQNAFQVAACLWNGIIRGRPAGVR